MTKVEDSQHPFGRSWFLVEVPVDAVEASDSLRSERLEQRGRHVKVSPAGTTSTPVGDGSLLSNATVCEILC